MSHLTRFETRKRTTRSNKQTNKRTRHTKSKHQKKPRDVASSWSPAPRPTPLIFRSHPPPSPLGRHATFLLPSGTKGDPASLEATIRSACTKSRSPSHPNASSERAFERSHMWSTCGIVALVHMSARGPDPSCSCQGTLAKGPAGAQRLALKQQDCRRLVAPLGKSLCGGASSVTQCDLRPCR